jgi:4-hydroxy-tetrahydrodipicolinate reductase
MRIRVCLAGATGWAGSAIARGIFEAEDMELVAGVSRTHAGRPLGEVLGIADMQTPIFGTVQEAFAAVPAVDVFVDFTRPQAAREHVLTALAHGAHVVIGTSGFAIGAVLMNKFAEMAARYFPQWEIIDYAHADKVDAPSGTARELARRLSKVGESQLEVPLEQIVGPRESRGVRMGGTQVHSVRLPGYMVTVEVIFASPDQKLVIRHEGTWNAGQYVEGALLAIRKVSGWVGLRRGLDGIIEL